MDRKGNESTKQKTSLLLRGARVFTNVYSTKRSAMIGALAVLAEKLRRCSGSVMESNYDEWVIRQDLKRQIVEKGSGDLRKTKFKSKVIWCDGQIHGH
ncbi:hypothetical protein BCON_0005g00040 [Botryotinia convoluta]|uniref:Uncharacterized protein n=1 Tax=Botryotinia convoluta TaxID=54673 RepID=A0A4Z1ITL6_9HELO|nr:hypothetical protein BCON_0005g00040 [Botryotinia convoluta]